MDMGTQAIDATLTKPSGYQPGGFFGEALTLKRPSDGPSELCDHR
jgi:hypothetical protein